MVNIARGNVRDKRICRLAAFNDKQPYSAKRQFSSHEMRRTVDRIDKNLGFAAAVYLYLFAEFFGNQIAGQPDFSKAKTIALCAAISASVCGLMPSSKVFAALSLLKLQAFQTILAGVSIP